MRVLIVEDETAAYENLVDILILLDPGIVIAGNTESVRQTVCWLKNNPLPDLILMDIHLSDGSAFSIFDSLLVDIPIIFITAYDEYAIEAFKVNSIDYLLKPVKLLELKRALDKFKKWSKQDIMKYISQLNQFAPSPIYKDKLLIPYKDKLQPIDLSEISFIYTTEKNTRIYLRNGKTYSYSKTLEQIEKSLNPADFIRANKQFILSRNSVKNITIWFDSRLLITTDVDPPERIYVSKNKATEFKKWMVKDSG
jgi:two-component system response regulator LytT